MVETLLDNGAYIEAETSNGCKALYCAAGAGQLEVHRSMPGTWMAQRHYSGLRNAV